MWLKVVPLTECRFQIGTNFDHMISHSPRQVNHSKFGSNGLKIARLFFCLSSHTNTHTRRPLVLLPAARFYNTPEEYGCIREAIQYAILAEVEFLVPDLGLGLFNSD